VTHNTILSLEVARVGIPFADVVRSSPQRFFMSHMRLDSLLTSTSSTTYVSKEPSLATQFTNVHALPPLLTTPHSLGPDGPNCSFICCPVAARKRYAIPNHPRSRALNFTHNLLGFVSSANCLDYLWYRWLPRRRVHHVSLCFVLPYPWHFILIFHIPY